VQRLFEAADPSWQAHLERYGPLPGRVDLVRLLRDSGLTGRGGAGYPTAVKVAGVAARPGGVVVANGAEGEPRSAKDRNLLRHAPHLVLDGLVVTARTVRARAAYVTTASPDIAAGLREEIALRERVGTRKEGFRIKVVEVAQRFGSGEESALVNALNGRPGIPSDRLVRVYERGVDRMPTLVQNVETLAHIALLARFGADWFRSTGTYAEPGTFLATVSGDVSSPGVFEVAHDTGLADLLDCAGGPADPQAVLVGGFHGAWLPGDQVRSARLSRAGLAPYGASVGAGIVVVLGRDRCGLEESAGIAGYLADQTAGQCGPCVLGLPRMADALIRLARRERDPRLVAEVTRLTHLVRGRGACTHPDGTARFVTSALRVFADEVAVHLGGGCSAALAR
jgi:NADH:ubiquinone oxidoreductase subunit F (NADH-binding)